MSLELILEKLDGVQKKGSGQYVALCPAHNDKHPSLAIVEKDSGIVLLHCFAGCGACEILAQLGLNFTDLYPQNAHAKAHGYRPVKRPFNARLILAALAGEALTIGQFSRLMASGTPLTDEQHARLVLASQRFFSGLDLINA